MLTFMYTGLYKLPVTAQDESLAEVLERRLHIDCEASSPPGNTSSSNAVPSNDGETNDGTTPAVPDPIVPSTPQVQESTSEQSSNQNSSCSCSCHLSPNDIPEDWIIPHEILVRGGEPVDYETFQGSSNGTYASFELHTYREWICCHGFRRGFGHENVDRCLLPCLCIAHEQGFVPWHLSTHAFVFATADYFDVPALKQLALDKFTANAHVCWRSAYFAQAIRDIFSNEMPDDDASPREVVIDILAEFPFMWDFESVKQVMEDIGAVTLAVLKKKEEKERENYDLGLVYNWQMAKIGNRRPRTGGRPGGRYNW
jgi:hypothetical protein